MRAQPQSQLGPVGIKPSSMESLNAPKPSSLESLNASKLSPLESLNSAAKLRVPVKKIPVKPSFSSESSLRAAAVAAGARIVTSSDAASILKVAQGKNAIHIMPSGVSTIKSSITGGTTIQSEARPNVRYIRTGMAAALPSTSPLSAVQSSSVKVVPPRVQHNTSAAEATTAVTPCPASDISKPDVKLAKEMKNSDLSGAAGNPLSKKPPEDKLPSLKLESESKKVQTAARTSDSMHVEVAVANKVNNTNNRPKGDHQNGIDKKIVGSSVKESKDHQSPREENCEIQKSNQEQLGLSNMLVDECSAKPEQSSERKDREETQQV